MTALVLAEHEGGSLKDATLAVVTAAASFGDVHILVAGSNVGAAAEQAAKIGGVSKVLVADDPALEHQLAENVAPLIAAQMGSYDAFLAPSTTTGKNIAPRLTVLRVTEPSKRQAGVKVGSVDELIDKIKETGVIG